MTAKTKEMFEAELEAVKEALNSMGGNTHKIDNLVDTLGSSYDFELPYSSLPKIHGEKWLNNELFA